MIHDDVQKQNVPKESFPLPSSYGISVTEDKGISPLYQRVHWHDVLEINLIKAGKGYYLINGETIDFFEGDILMINSNDLHQAFEQSNLTMLVISFDPSWLMMDQYYDPIILSSFKKMGVEFTNLLDRTHPRMKKLRNILLNLQAEHLRQDPAYITLVRAQLLQFLAYVVREFKSESVSQAKEREPIISQEQLNKIRSVITTMEDKYGAKWDLKSLSDLVFLSPSRFSAVFKQAVGVSPMKYLIQIRLANAVRLLEDTDQRIIDIAEECGFLNLSNFNRLFKNNVGVTPEEIRSKSQ